MARLPDSVLDHLRRVAELPDLSGTRYDLEEELGRGGMGVVYAARDNLLDRRVALKVVRVTERDAQAAARLLEEARIAARLEHPGIVPIHDAGYLLDGRLFYAMKLVDGQRLDQFFARELSIPARLRVLQRVCEAVAFAHSRGVIHRDLKPENIMIGSFGEVLTLDWGIARPVGIAKQSGAVGGTPRYMAPEQAAGREHDHRADIFSLGQVIAFLLPAGAPRPLAAIAAKAAFPDPSGRYDSALELAADVERYLERLPVTAYRETIWERTLRFLGRNRTLVLLLTAYVLVRLAVLFIARF